MSFILRPYQGDTAERVWVCLSNGHKSTMVVLPTGTGKTVIFAHIAKRFAETYRKKVLIVAHREELIFQAAHKVEQILGEPPQIEMGEYHSSPKGFFGSSVFITSVQTMSKESRYSMFDPSEFCLVIVDEAHHCVPRCKTYNRVVTHFTQDSTCKLLGATATADRLDERALGQMFESVAYEYQLPDAIRDGWLVPIEQEYVTVEHLDLRAVRMQGDDFNERDLAEVMNERVLHEIAKPSFEKADGRPMLVFTPPRPKRKKIKTCGCDPDAECECGEFDYEPPKPSPADELAKIYNGYKDGSAIALHGDTERELRRGEIEQFKSGKRQILVSCSLFLEGFDAPNAAVIAMARPTASRSLYAQAVGRATRPLGGLVDGLDSEEDRRSAIALSAKPNCLVIDFVGNAGRHKLISSVDILGGMYEDEIIERAKKNAEQKSAPSNMMDELVQAAMQADEEKKIEEARKHSLRKQLDVKAKYTSVKIDPFDLLDIQPGRCPGWHVGRMPTDRQVEALRKFKVPEKEIEGLDFWKATKMMDALIGRIKKGFCTYKQAELLRKHGYDTNIRFEDASAIIARLAKNGWRRPD